MSNTLSEHSGEPAGDIAISDLFLLGVFERRVVSWFAAAGAAVAALRSQAVGRTSRCRRSRRWSSRRKRCRSGPAGACGTARARAGADRCADRRATPPFPGRGRWTARPFERRRRSLGDTTRTSSTRRARAG
eukprot:1473920-Pleurochrysis_carterae.AAC.1